MKGAVRLSISPPFENRETWGTRAFRQVREEREQRVDAPTHNSARRIRLSLLLFTAFYSA